MAEGLGEHSAQLLARNDSRDRILTVATSDDRSDAVFECLDARSDLN